MSLWWWLSGAAPARPMCVGLPGRPHKQKAMLSVMVDSRVQWLCQECGLIDERWP